MHEDRKPRESVRVAAYQAPLLDVGSMEALDLIRKRDRGMREAEGSVFCAVLRPSSEVWQITRKTPFVRHPAQSTRFRPRAAVKRRRHHNPYRLHGARGKKHRLYNAAAVFCRGAIKGVYRKLHPAINRSVYTAGTDVPVFQAGALTFGVVICNDSNLSETRSRGCGPGRDGSLRADQQRDASCQRWCRVTGSREDVDMRGQ